jgi:2-keto-4-pentenoate hydratase/2-oxohepta-3-ene-1,7-dioic acid hydratase in catechol pathway
MGIALQYVSPDHLLLSVYGPMSIRVGSLLMDGERYELEYGIYIGKEGKNIPRERAEEHIAGYTVFNDISARDIQVREMLAGGLGPAKGQGHL